MPIDPVAAFDRHRLAAALHGGAGNDGVGAMCVDFVDAFVGQTERNELGNAVIGNVPADGTGALGQ